MNRLLYIKNIKLDELSFQRISDALLRRLSNLTHILSWILPKSKSKNNKRLLMKYKDRHKGERCFIIANGPSLARTDLSLLKGEYVIGMNRGYLLKEQRGVSLTYLVVMDILCAINPFITELIADDTIQFSNWNARKLYNGKHKTIFLIQRHKVQFSKNLINGIWGGHSVTFACIQLAYFMGFDTVILIGKDHNYKKKGIPGEELLIFGDESNHGIDNYYSKNMIWKLPDYKGEELAYQLALEAYDKDGRRIYDATNGGELTVFEKIEYLTLFKE